MSYRFFCLAALGGALLLTTGCGDEETSSTPSAPDRAVAVRAAGPRPDRQVVPPRPQERTRLDQRLLGLDHGQASNFWPQPGWSPPSGDGGRPDTQERESGSGGGLYGLGAGASGAPADIPVPEPNPRREARAEASAAASSGGTPLKQGQASWYGPGFHGRKTANGETYDQNAMTAAMTGVPLGIRVRVECTDRSKCTGRTSIEVRVNDRGPYQRENGRWVPHATRVIDLSKKAMETLGGVHAGIIPVKVYRLD